MHPILHYSASPWRIRENYVLWHSPVFYLPFWRISLTSPEQASGYALTQTAVTPVLNGYSFNATTSLVSSATDPIGTAACTIVATLKPTGWGEGGFGAILDNGKLIFDMGDAQFFFSSDGTTTASAAAGGITLGQTYRIGVTRSADGASTNFYVNGALSGGANQDSGTPDTGASALTAGNAAGATATFAGTIVEIVGFLKLWTSRTGKGLGFNVDYTSDAKGGEQTIYH